MAFKLAEAFVNLGVRDGGLKSGLATAKNFITRSIGGIGAAFGVSIGIAGAVALGGFAVTAAANAEEVQSKFEAVFKELTTDATDFSREFAKSIGRSVGQIKRQMSEFQDVLVPLGFGRDEALELSKALQTAAIDLASFNNKSDEEAAQALLRALTGEREMLKSLGIVILESDVKLELLRKGQSKLTGEALKQAKALATLALIQRGSTDAQGDALKTSGAFTNQMKRLKGSMQDLAVAVGNLVLPELTHMVRLLADVTSELETFATTSNRVAQDFRMLFALEFGIGIGNMIDDMKILSQTWGIHLQIMLNDFKIFNEGIKSSLRDDILSAFAPDLFKSIEGLRTKIGGGEVAPELRSANEGLIKALALLETSMRRSLIEDRNERLRERLLKGGPGGRGRPGVGQDPSKVKPLSGFFGFSDLSKKIQEQTLKQQKPQEKMARLMDADKIVQNQMLQVNRQIAANTAPGAASNRIGNIEVATP